MKVLDLLLIAVSYALTLVLVAALVRHKLHRQFLFFFIYLVYSLVRTPAAFSVIGNYSLYFKVFWMTEGVSVILGLLATYESFMQEFKAFYSLPGFRFALPSLIIGVALYAYWLAESHPPTQATILISLIVALEVGFQYVQIGIVLLSAALIRIFKLSAGRHATGIQIGFGISSLGILFASLVRSEFGTRFPFAIRLAPSVAYIIALFVWLASLSKPERGPRGNQLSLEQMLGQLREYLGLFRRDA